MKIKTVFFLPVVFAALFLFVGCASDAPKRDITKAKRAMGTRPQESYPELSGYRITLRQVGPRVLYSGDDGKLTFALRNVGKESFRLVEWYSNETDNIIVYCQPWLTGMQGPAEDGWIELSFDIKMPPIRYPLELMPGNQVLVEKELPFVDKLAISPGTERRFFVRAKLNLKSVSAETPVSTIIVRSAADRATTGR